MSDFRAIYRILRELSDAIDAEELDPRRLTPEAVGASGRRFNALLVMLVENGYVEGVTARRYASSRDPWPRAALVALRIALKGLEYLHENPLMRKCAEAAVGTAPAI
jgi:hypothetical protein